jgi:hypothetical protein
MHDEAESRDSGGGCGVRILVAVLEVSCGSSPPGVQLVNGRFQSTGVTVTELQQRCNLQEDREEFMSMDSAVLFGSLARGAPASSNWWLQLMLSASHAAM